jgi:5'-nucleotidase
VLERIARTISDDITVVAPAEEQSGKSRSLTLTEPFRVRRMADDRYAVRGTPTDCVMFALAEAMKDSPPDLILSGVNRGGNLGEDVSYSGTVSAAMEGALAGIRSVALSQRYERTGMGDAGPLRHRRGVGRARAQAAARRALGAADPGQHQLPAGPARSREGIKPVSQGLRDYGRVGLDKRIDPRGFPYYWLAMSRLPHIRMPDTDLEAIEQGWITVTPLHLDLTHRDSLESLKSLYC